VPLPEPAASIAAGAEHGCAITETTGSLHCWGSNALGQLGAGEDSSAGIRRVDLGGLRAAAVLAGATASTTFAVLETGGLRGWGNDDAGQAGYGDRMDGVEDETWRIGELPDIPIFRAPKK
jgi:alpha-tubulin suppressor-like RCC1 family protein